MAFNKGSLGINQNVKEYTDGLEGRIDSAFKDVDTNSADLNNRITREIGQALTLKGLYTGSANQITVNGIFYFANSNVTALPSGVSDGFIWNIYDSSTRRQQILFKYNGLEIYSRVLWGSTWSSWTKLN